MQSNMAGRLTTMRVRFSSSPVQAPVAGNWSSLASVGSTPISGSPVTENFEVLRPDLSDRRWKRRDVDVRRYAPECVGVQRRVCSERGERG